MLNEIRKEKLLENADKLHSGGPLSSPRPRRSRLGVVWLNLAVLGAILLVFVGVAGA